MSAKAAVASLAEHFGSAPLDVGGLGSGGQLGGSLSAQHLLHPEPLERL
ncbi:hypothetical protein ACFQ51_01560 [Streptomyces kaempferi]